MTIIPRNLLGVTGPATIAVAPHRPIPHLRWMIRRDLGEVLAIEHASSDRPMGEAEFLRLLRERNHIGYVAEIGERVAGFMVYAMHPHHLELLDIAVHPDWRRRGIGRAMVKKLIGKLSMQRCPRLVARVRDDNLDSHLFLRACGLAARTVTRGYFTDTGADSYNFVWRKTTPDV